MALLKEDGSLDIERINNLPLKEYMDEMGCLSKEMINEYITKLPIKESKEPMKATIVDSVEEYGVDADEMLNEIMKKYVYKQ